MKEFTAEERAEFRRKAYEKRESDTKAFLEGQTAQLKTYYNGVPKLHQWSFVKALSGAATKREAIRAKCLDCSGYSTKEVEECTVITCPLYEYRPYKN